MRVWALSSVLFCTVALGDVYQNHTFGFQITYPQSNPLHTTFDEGYLLGNSWAYNLAGVGVPVVRIVSADTSFKNGGNTDSFLAELRIGVGTNNEALQNCIPADANRTVKINGQTFYVIALGDAGMSHVLNVTSYRTIYNNNCYVLDQVETYSQAGGSPGANLTAAYTGLEKVINTFTFTNS